MMYFMIRYDAAAITASFFTPQEAILRQWHQQVPPDAVAGKRNDDIYAAQGNRNPFVDHPEFAERITSLSGTSSAPVRRIAVLDESAISYSTSLSTQLDAAFALANGGNTTFSLTQITTATGALILTDSVPLPLEVLPGEAVTRKFKLDPAYNTPTFPDYYDTLILQTTSTNKPSFRVPVHVSVISTTGFGEIVTPAFQLFPNPSSDAFDISSHDGSSFEVQITSLQGRNMGYYKALQGNAHVDIADLSAGIYLVGIHSEGRVTHKKLVVSR
jgi:hypothetical protein